MTKKANIIRPVHLHITLPEDLHGRLSAYLFSPSQGRVPNGAYQKFFCERILEFFNRGNPNAESGTNILSE
jgi:hypothetical protein